MRSAALAALSLCAALVGGCRELGLEPGGTPRERYERKLEKAGLLATALGRDWAIAGASALGEAPAYDTPLAESGYLAPEEPGAVGFRITVRRGQRLVVAATLAGAAAGPLFLDVYTLATDSGAVPRHLLSADSGATRLETEIRRDGAVLVRLQPELLRGGRYEIRIHLEPALGFPVSGRAAAAIESRFGAQRDAGRRSHEGVDIFAPRGTPVVAAAPGVATRVGTNRLGGNVVFVSDRLREEAHYYAHLDTQLVAEGVSVRAGDTLGLVGNTGNARSTPPHLHFGIYARGGGRGRGAIDPFPYLAAPDTAPPPVTVPDDSYGGFRRTARAGSVLAAIPGGDSGVRLPAKALVRIIGGIGSSYRVVLPDGRRGFVSGSATEPIRSALAAAAAGGRVLERPDSGAVVMTVVPERGGEVVARFGAFDFVRSGDRAGWLVR